MVMARKPAHKWFCKCMSVDDEIVYIVVTALSSKDASTIVHTEYAIAYVEDILTPLEMALNKQFLSPTMIGVQQLIPWWTSTPKNTPTKPTTPTPQNTPQVTSEAIPTEHTRKRPPTNNRAVHAERRRPPTIQGRMNRTSS